MTHAQQQILALLTAATVAPLLSAVAVIFLGKKFMGKSAGWIATFVMGSAFACAFYAAILWIGEKNTGAILWNIPWLPLSLSSPQTLNATPSWLYLGAMIDSLTIAMMVMVTGIATLVHLYSIGYMHGDKRFERFFAYLSLFTFSMLGIVMSNSLLMLFVFWELVGLTSYLLIGFWFEKRGPQLACKKAFVMNRIGDMGFIIGLGILFYKLGGNILLPAAEGVVVDGESIQSVFGAVRAAVEADGHSITNPPLWLTAAGIGLFFGAIGKSAQFPLHTWLPDAMEGPTPVSSIVHSATMVAAGVYLTARIYPILTPSAHLFIACIGLITLFIAACMAIVMTDIKRVLAYSTLSQLGYMILGLGAGAYAFALFHLITHAFFKCCLFQCAGSVINAAHHEQDMRKYGGLYKKMPVTATCYLLCTLAIAGASIPFLNIAGYPIGVSGFYSKDGIIAGTVTYGQELAASGWVAAHLFYWGPLVVAYMTVFYMARSFALTFLGKPRDQHLYDHAHEAPPTMTIPQVILALMAVLSIPMILPILELILASTPPVAYLQPVIDTSRSMPNYAYIEHHLMSHGFHVTHAGLLHGFAWAIMLLVGIVLYTPGMKYASKIAALPGLNALHYIALNKFGFDGLYDILLVNITKAFAAIIAAIDRYIVDGLVNLAGLATRALAFLTGLFDNKFVDGMVNGAAASTQNAGNFLRVTQVGRVRTYVLLLFSSAAFITLVVVTVVIVTT